MSEEIEIQVPLKSPHPKQQEFLSERKRFNVLKCGRRFGKTEICQELISECVQYGTTVAYFAPTYKDLYEVWQETKRIFHPIIHSVSETVKQITFITGSKVDMWSMEDPDSGRGRKYHRAIMDECEKAGKFQEAWEQTIRATLTDYKGDAYFLSTPQFGDTYFKKICKNETEFPDWKTFTYTTYDNPFIDPEEIEQARLLLLPSIFNCEYLAQDEDGKSLNPFAHQFDSAYHVSDLPTFRPDLPLIISIDFNLNPFAVTFWQYFQDRQGHHLYGIDEAEIQNGSLPAMVELIRSRYGEHLHSCVITGDAMGNQGNIARRDNSSHYMELRRELRLSAHQIRVPANPTHINSRADVNYLLFESKRPGSGFTFLLSRSKMPKTIQDNKIVQCDAFGGGCKTGPERSCPARRLSGYGAVRDQYFFTPRYFEKKKIIVCFVGKVIYNPATMNCQSCHKVVSIPECMTEDGTYNLIGISFPENLSEDLTVQITDTATGRMITDTVTTDGSGDISGIDLSPMLPLMNHLYVIRAYAEDGSEATLSIDGEEGCCAEFTSRKGEVDGDVPLSLAVCSI